MTYTFIAFLFFYSWMGLLVLAGITCWDLGNRKTRNTRAMITGIVLIIWLIGVYFAEVTFN